MNVLLKVYLVFLLLTISSFAFCEDSIQFVGRVWYIQNTNEFYTTMEFRDSVDVAFARKKLLQNTDSTITKEYFLSRREISLDIADDYFDFTLYREISIFNQAHEKVTKAYFERVEYYEDMIDGMFIAVFKPEHMPDEFKNELIFYGIGTGLEPLLIKKFDHSEITKKSLDKHIQQYIEYNMDGLLKTKHIDLKESPVKKVSILSIEDLDSFTYSTYLLEHDGTNIRTLKTLNEDFVFWDLIPIPYLVHNKPVFIVEIIVPDSDYTGYKLAVYDGSEYQLQDKMRVSL